MKRLAGLLGNVGLSVVTLFVLALCLESGTRLLADVPLPLAVRDPRVGATYRPGFEGVVRSEESGREVALRFSREGFRGPDRPLEPAPGTRRIAILGDSFIAALACEEEDTSVRRLERALAVSRPDGGWEVMNFGVEGSSTGQQLALYRHVVSRYRPDVVIAAYFVGNDFTDNSPRLSRFPRIYYRLEADGELVQLPLSAARNRLSSWLNRHSRFYVWQKNALRRARPDRAGGNEVYTADPGPDLAAVWRLNARLIEALDEAVEADGGRFALVVLPSAAQVYDDVWDGRVAAAGATASRLERDHPDRMLAEIAAEAGIPSLSLTAALRAAAGGPAARTPADRLLFFRGGGHLTPRGHAVAADAIHRFLTEGPGRGLLEPGEEGDPGF